MSLADEHDPLLNDEIRSWLDDDEQLADLGRRCVNEMLGHRKLPTHLMGAKPAQILRTLLVEDWLRDIEHGAAPDLGP